MSTEELVGSRVVWWVGVEQVWGRTTFSVDGVEWSSRCVGCGERDCSSTPLIVVDTDSRLMTD